MKILRSQDSIVIKLYIIEALGTARVTPKIILQVDIVRDTACTHM